MSGVIAPLLGPATSRNVPDSLEFPAPERIEQVAVTNFLQH